MIKMVNFIRILSITLYLGVLGLVYAYLPVMVRTLPQDDTILVHREYFFYYAIGVFAIVNLFTWILIRMINPLIMLKRGEMATAWFNTIASVINIYLALVLGFIGVLNNPLHVSASGFAYLNYLGPVMLIIWMVGFFYLSVNKKSTT